MLAESRRQMAKYMILWEYQDKGYKKYIYIAEGKNCDSCSRLNKKKFNISDARTGKNFPPLHPNCDCLAGILDENEKIIALTGGGKASGTASFEKADEDANQVISWDNILDGIQTGVDIIGLVPGAGEVADGINAGIYVARGDYANAGLSAAAMIPFAGMAATGGKLTRKALKYNDEIIDGIMSVTKHSDEVGEQILKHGDDFVEGAGKAGRSVDDVLDGTSAGRVTKGSSTQYIKSGGYDKALDDFNSLKPSDVKDIPNGKVGTLPDGRTVNVRTNSSYKTPTLEIYDGSKSIKIRYDK